MKNRKALHALWCVPLMAGCAANPENRGALLDIQPVYNVRHSSDNPEMHYQLGRYYQGQRRYDQALAAYEHALKASPEFVEARNGKGVIYANQGKYDLAIEEFKAALEHAPQAAHVHNNLGYAYYLKGQYEDAAAAMEQAIAFDPDSRRAHNNLGLAYAQIGDKALAHQELTKGAERMAEAPPAAAEPAKPVAEVESAMQPEHVAATPDPVSLPPQAEPSVAAQVPASDTVVAAEPVETLAVPTDAGVIRRADGESPPAAQRVEAAPPQVETAVRQREPVAPGVMAVALEEQPQLPRKHGQLNIEISNGNGVTGMAKKVGSFLKDQGYPVRRITNDKPFSKPYTYVYYRDGYLDEALRLRADIPYTLVPIQDSKMLKGIHVRVVLGKDMVQQFAHVKGGKKPSARLVVASKSELDVEQDG